MNKNYGITRKNEPLTEVQRIKESISLKGFSIVENVFDVERVKQFSLALDEILPKQESHFKKEELAMMKEEDVVRMPLAYNSIFLELITNSLIKEVVTSLLGGYYILHLQNGIINRPARVHHQTSWHRDLPYQDFVSSEPLGVNAFLCIDDFSVSSGATFLLPFSHKMSYFPSEDYVNENEVQLIAPPGSIAFFDSMLYHRAGMNTGSFIRRGVNTMFVRPILKQQIDIPELLKGKYKDDVFFKKVLGYDSEVPGSVEDYRKRRLHKSKR
ncbi:MAG: phytanoyl-CoA dioxygenase family protein [Cyclobacteriaceae bacterium]|nr:phytanoyl-CoA dioxygenase family protein [Cyclobacteriaceae bacterium]